jgi:hypothetical protein
MPWALSEFCTLLIQHLQNASERTCRKRAKLNSLLCRDRILVGRRFDADDEAVIALDQLHSHVLCFLSQQ